MKNKVVRAIISDTTGRFIKSQIEIDDPMEAALMSFAIERLLEEFQVQQEQGLMINKILKDLGRDDFEHTEFQEEIIKYLSNMVEALKVKNEILTIVE
ncbi:hypothetical protein HMPREF1084_03965 [Clostridium butyricum 60E.3]|uniref:Uncharacterized protein n=1 Tax=Clostridium butyricum TaxID=1492 RepID=A0A6N3AUU6_CLOBU|nr:MULTISPECIES: hypothetical protein [Clostridium]ENZ30120.1 hypothetical protein HMPREF1084_03965 [Clostridium butyricum 60E.3]MDU1116607.1 hypothetical protein [Clostridium sp.]MDU1126756.1 hypothetical protein [Clostridium sp.]MDU3583071.1 hypothetical protein [Clostridium butyricum]MDU3596202.1 hypothetical protein [Clostridium butyricum]